MTTVLFCSLATQLMWFYRIESELPGAPSIVLVYRRCNVDPGYEIVDAGVPYDDIAKFVEFVMRRWQ